MKLIVVESAGHAASLRSVLRKNTEYTVVSCNGWYAGLPTDSLGIDSNDYSFNWKVLSASSLSSLLKNIEQSDSVYAAMPPSDDGEALASQVRITAERLGKTFLRLPLSSLSERDVMSSFSGDTNQRKNLEESYLAAESLDRFLTFQLGSAIKKQVGISTKLSLLSLFSVAELVRREKLALRSTPTAAWQVRVLFDDGAVGLSTLLTSEEEANLFSDSLRKCSVSYNSYPIAYTAPAPFSFLELLRFTGSRYGFTGTQVIQGLSQLYGKGFISFPFVSSNLIPHEVADDIRGYIKKKLDPSLLSGSPAYTSSLPGLPSAIYPTNIATSPSMSSLSSDLKTMYSAIWFRALSSQGASCRCEAQSYDMRLPGSSSDEDPLLSICGEKQISAGWHKLAVSFFGNAALPLTDTHVPAISEIVVLPTRSLPIFRHTSASLLDFISSYFELLPSDVCRLFASLSDGLVESRAGVLSPTTSGMLLSSYLKKVAPGLFDPESLDGVLSSLHSVGLGWVTLTDFMSTAWSWAREQERLVLARKYRISKHSSPNGSKTHIMMSSKGMRCVASDGQWSCYAKYDNRGRLVLEGSKNATT